MNHNQISSSASISPVILRSSQVCQLNADSPEGKFKKALILNDHKTALSMISYFAHFKLDKRQDLIAKVLMCAMESPHGFEANGDSLSTIQRILEQYPRWIHPFDALAIIKHFSKLETENHFLIISHVFKALSDQITSKDFQGTALCTDRFQIIRNVLYHLFKKIIASELLPYEHTLLSVMISNPLIMNLIFSSRRLHETEKSLIFDVFSKTIELNEDRTDLRNAELAFALLENNPNTFSIFSHDQMQIIFAHVVETESTSTSPIIDDLIEFILRIEFIVLNSDLIVRLYERTIDFGIITAIDDYIIANPEQDIRLPFRTDIDAERENAVEYHVAYDVHNYANKLDITCIQYISSALRYSKIAVRNFTINDLQHTIDSAITNKKEKEKIIAVLKKINSDQESDYFHKFINFLPSLNEFIFKISQDQNIPTHIFWKLFLKQSFLESATAYEHATSCIKGIYERLFSGLRTMDPGIDAIFLCSETLKQTFPTDSGIRNPTIEILKSEKMLCYLIENLVRKNIEKITKSEESFLQENIHKYLIESLEQNIFIQLEEKLKLLPAELDFDMQKSVFEIWQSRKKIAEKKISSFQNSLHSIDLSNGINSERFGFIEVINNILLDLKSSLHEKMSFKDISAEDISEAVYSMIQSIADIANPETVKKLQFQHNINEIIATEFIMREELIREQNYLWQEISIV